MVHQLQKICVYCASSQQVHQEYMDSANRLGQLLARHGISIVYGGGSVGLMGALADGALSKGGEVIGVLPRFMYDLEWGHKGLSKLNIVNDLHERKRLMIDQVDATVALPGGSGTLEELLEALTWKRLGLYLNPIILVNMRRYFDPLVAMLEGAIKEHFMDYRHRLMWSVVGRIDDVIEAIDKAPKWSLEARKFAAL